MIGTFIIIQNTIADFNFLNWNNGGIGKNTVFMFLTCFLSFGILFIIEYQFIKIYFYKLKNIFTKPINVTEEIDSDILEESNRIREMNEGEYELKNLVVKDLITKLRCPEFENGLCVDLDMYVNQILLKNEY